MKTHATSNLVGLCQNREIRDELGCSWIFVNIFLAHSTQTLRHIHSTGPQKEYVKCHIKI